jgi:hypothetical protein
VLPLLLTVALTCENKEQAIAQIMLDMCPKQQHELMLAYKHALKHHQLQQCVTQAELLNVT